MRLSRFSIFLLLVFTGVACSSTEQTVQQKTNAPSVPVESVTALTGNLPAENQEKTRWVFRELAATGRSGMKALTDMLAAPGTGDDTRARFAVNGLAKYVSHPGAESARDTYEKVLLEGLQSNYHPAVKSFLMEQLELLGTNRSVPVLASFIGDERLNKSAVHALRAVNTPQAREALVQALPGTEGERRAAVMKALGDMKATSAAPEILSSASSDDWQTQKAALYALAQSGNPAAVEPFTTAVDEYDGYKDTVVESYYVLLADRLAGEGHQQQSVELSQKMLSGDYRPNVKSAALTILFENGREVALEPLLDAAAGTNQHLRFTALSILQKNGELEIPEPWVNQFDEYAPEVQADIIAKLGPGRASVSMLMPYIESDHQAVRAAAAQAVATIGGEEALSGLLDALLQTQTADDIAILKGALLQFPTDALVSRAAAALPSASAQAKVPLIEILGARRATGHLDTVIAELESPDQQVRLAVFRELAHLMTAEDLSRMPALLESSTSADERDALVQSLAGKARESARGDSIIVEQMSKLPAKQKAAAIDILPQIGGQAALDAVVEARSSRSELVSSKADSALAAWPDASAIAPLLDALKNSAGASRKELLQGYTRLVTRSKYASDDKVQFLKDGFAAASSTEEKSMVLKTLADLDTPDALQVVVPHFEDDNPEIREQALRSAARILAQSKADTEQQLSLLEVTTSAEIKSQVEQYLQQIQSNRQQTDNFTSLFNGEDLSGWTGDKGSYRVEDGQIISRDGAAGNLFTKQEYSDFILKFEFKLTPGANNGLGIRAPLEGDPAYDAMELQIIDNTAEKYAELEPYQYHGSVYGVAPAERGYLNPPGEWNTQAVMADGSQITIKVNGETILQTDLQEAAKPETMDGKDHPGLFRESGHIGFLGHGDEVAFRNIRIRDLNVYLPDYSSGPKETGSMNQPPEGFTALFNGENLEGWKGLVGNPESRAEMSDEALAQKQKEANAEMRKHWSVRDGVLTFDGDGHSLVTQKKYKDFEMMVDWKIEPGGDSGIYLRGTPQVQIWDITEWPQGSGGLYNNQKHPSEPLVAADNAIGEWNSMRIKMIDEKVTVHLNDRLVVDNVVMENYWNRDKPIYPEGQIELQSHSTPLYFKNIFVREIPRREPLFNGNDLTGWQPVGDNENQWYADDGILYTEGGTGWLSTVETYDNFRLELEYRLPEGGNSGIFLRAPREGSPAYEGMEIQLLDDTAEENSDLAPWQYTGSIYDVLAPSPKVSTTPGEWHKMEITADGSDIKIRLNGEIITDTDLVNYMDRLDEHPGLKRRSGYIGLQSHDSRAEFRNITIREIKQ